MSEIEPVTVRRERFRTVPPLLPLTVTLLLASVFSVGIELFRERYSQDAYYGFLDWNLFLAWVPFCLALAAREAVRLGQRQLAIALGALWLLAFPNAPYMLTDFVHLGDSSMMPLWFDGLMLSCFAWTALLLGFVSLFVMHGLWRERAGPVKAWVTVGCVLFLGSLGVYIGRFVQYNSWDAVSRPASVARLLLRQVEDPVRHPLLDLSLVALMCSLGLGYLVFYSVSCMWLRQGRPWASALG